jgi:hypothetical protein
MKTTNEIFKEVLDELGFSGYKPSQMSNSDYWMCTERAMEKYAKQTQQEQDKKMYSEEDMKSFGDWCRNDLLNTEYSFEKLDEHLKTWEQIKNK